MPALLVARLFPLGLLLMNLGAAVVAFQKGDIQRSLYWVASAACIACVAW